MSALQRVLHVTVFRAASLQVACAGLCGDGLAALAADGVCGPPVPLADAATAADALDQALAASLVAPGSLFTAFAEMDAESLAAVRREAHLSPLCNDPRSFANL